MYGALPAFCRVTATLTPSSDSDIEIEVWMPTTDWSGKLQAVGNGAFTGSIAYPTVGNRAPVAATRPAGTSRSPMANGCFSAGPSIASVAGGKESGRPKRVSLNKGLIRAAKMEILAELCE